MDGAKRSDLLTTDYCDRKIGELFKQQNMGWGKSEEELLLITTEIAVLQRLREHVVNGEMITINEKEGAWQKMRAHIGDILYPPCQLKNGNFYYPINQRA